MTAGRMKFPEPPAGFVESLQELDSDHDDDDALVSMPRSIKDPDECRRLGKEQFDKASSSKDEAEADKFFNRAIAIWRQGLKLVLSRLCKSQQAMFDKNLSSLDLKFNLNIAMASIKLGEIQQALDHLEKALARRESLDPEDLKKLLYRKAVALDKQGKLEEAIEVLKDLKDNGGSAAGEALYNEVTQKYNAQKQKQKDVMKKMFDKMEHLNVESKKERAENLVKLSQQCVGQYLPVDVEALQQFDSGEFNTGQSQWYLSFPRTVVRALQSYAEIIGQSYAWENMHEMTVYFLGASSTCELRFLGLENWPERFPSVKKFNFVLVGFLGNLSPEDQMEFDAGAAEVTQDEGSSSPLKQLMSFTRFGKEKGARDKKCSPAQDHAKVSAAINVPEAELDMQSVFVYSYYGFAQDLLAMKDVRPQPSLVIMAQPHLHRYFTDWVPVLQKLMYLDVLTIVLGGSLPDNSFTQDKQILEQVGCKVLTEQAIPNPFCMFGQPPTVRKNNHFLLVRGGTPNPDPPLTMMMNLQDKHEIETRGIRLTTQDGRRADGTFGKKHLQEIKQKLDDAEGDSDAA